MPVAGRRKLASCAPAVATRSSSPVNRKRRSDDDEESRTTLGDLLYSDRSRERIPEDDWVRLVQAVAAGDQQALRALYERTHRLVFTLALRISGDRESAEEITLDVFHDVWRRAAKYSPEGGPVLGWIMNQARSRAIDRLRFDQRKKRAPQQPAHREDEIQLAAPVDEMDAGRRRGLLQEALTALTGDERQAIETAFFSELTYSETAARLNQPLGTVKSRVRSALAKLRKALDAEGRGS
jgi:RNA polymerase sigma-70 factor (ECF subfamily)